MASTKKTPPEGEPYKPMAAPEITMQDLLEAFEARMEARTAALEKRIEKLEVYHFGKPIEV